MAARQIVKTVKLPAGSKPWMLRVAPDGKELWVQTGGANTNVVLAADDLATLATQPCGKGPVRNGWSPDGRYSIVLNSGDGFAHLFDARSRAELKRLELGGDQSGLGFTRDGRTAFITVTGADSVAVVDLAKLDVVEQVKVGKQPMGILVR